jgi:hypothetical protein
MTKLILTAGLAALVLTGIIILSQTKSSPDSIKLMSGPVKEESDNEQDEMEKRMQQEIELIRDPKLGFVPTERLIRALEFRNKKFGGHMMNRAAAAVPGISWTERGPNNVGGRTRALIFDLNDNSNGYKKVWAGGVGGGLWYTNDITVASPVWTKIDDLMENLAVTAIAQNPANPMILYAGTGEGWFNADAIKGLGIWKSTNGGATWGRLTSTANFAYVNDLQFDNNGHIYAALRQRSGADAAGVQKSTDGGITWTQVLGSPVFGSDARGADLELAANGDLYATLGTISSNGGVYTSDFALNGAATGDAGTWTDITPNSGGAINTPTNFWHRIELTTAPSNSNIVYALFQGFNSNNCTSIQQYNKSTNTWSVKTVPTIFDQGSNSNFSRGQAWYDLIATVDPNNENTLYIGGVDALRSNDGGSTWTQMTSWSLFGTSEFTAAQNVHADHHVIVYAPGSSSRALWGTDGGVHYTVDANIATPAKPTFVSKNTGYNVTQFYSAAIHPTSVNYFLGGTQDNGTQQFTGAGLNNTTMITGGDGGFAHIDQNNGNLQFTAFTNNSINVSTDGGLNFDGLNILGGSFISPTDFDDRAKILYASNANGSYKRWINPASADGPYEQVNVTAFGTGNVTHVSVSPLTPNRVYFGTNRSTLIRVDNAHTGTSNAGTVIFTHPIANSSVSSVAIDPTNEDHMLVTFSNYGVTSVYESLNATTASPTFQSLDNNGVNLPDMPVWWVMFDPRNTDWVLIATELGVWSTGDLNGTATDWQPTNTGFANARVDMLQYRPSDGLIAAATHGRGLYTASVPLGKTIMFRNTGIADAESSVTGTDGCKGYKEYDIPMMITGAPSGDAIVTISPDAGNTAVQGVDFDFTTNGNFTSPSNTLSFLSGATADQSFKLRVYNDDILESIENIKFTYTVTGSTDAVKSNYNSSFIHVITDNDVNPFTSNSGDWVIGSGLRPGYLFGLNSSNGLANNRGRVQNLYLASELIRAGMKPGQITALKFTVHQKNSTGAYQGFTVSMANSAVTDLNTGFASTTTVFSGDYTTVAGVNTINLSTPFVWDGTSNIIVQFCYDNGATTITNDYVKATRLKNQAYYFVSRVTTAAGTGCSLSAQYVYDDRTDMTFTASHNGTSIETVLNASKVSTVGSSTTHNFYSSADGELLTTIKNASASLGCVTARIDEQGTTWQNFTNGLRSQKVFEVTPTTNNGASYDIVLYYSNAELGGKDPATLRMVKTSAASAATATPSNSVIVKPVVSDFGTYKSFTATFTGFSRFFLIDNAVTLPLVLKEFTGKLNSGSHSDLKWTTSSEYHTKEFVVERALDGVHFEKIGTVAAAGNSSVERNYKLTDPYAAEAVNYYRLKMVDMDGKFTYSPLVIIRNPGITGKDIRVLTNPFNSYVDLFFTEIPASAVSVRISDATGRVRYNNGSVVPASNRWRLDVSMLNLSKGNYILEVRSKEGMKSFKIVKN